MRIISPTAMKPFRKVLILTLVGLYLSGFMLNAAAALLQGDNCGRVCCCMQKKQHGSLPSINSSARGCCSANTARPCDLQSGTTADIPDSAIQKTQLSGERLLSYLGGASHLLNSQHKQMESGLVDRKLPFRHSVPLYLETLSLLC